MEGDSFKVPRDGADGMVEEKDASRATLSARPLRLRSQNTPPLSIGVLAYSLAYSRTRCPDSSNVSECGYVNLRLN
jgi:hypothetical protein